MALFTDTRKKKTGTEELPIGKDYFVELTERTGAGKPINGEFILKETK